MSARAVELLCERIANPDVKHGQLLVAPPISPRKSTGPARTGQ
jgi:DNA-binding LacI/PurR family transcriptional regulator